MNGSFSRVRRDLARRRGDYGVDAPYVLIALGLAGAIFLAISLLSFWVFADAMLGVISIVSAIVFLLSTLSYLYTTRWGKFWAWATILAKLSLRGDEQVLDMGCGRGAVLLMVARLLPKGKAIGVDLWQSSDQSGNARSATQRNAALEGVTDRIELHTADMQKLPFADDAFDMVLSSLAIHNIQDSSGRNQAINEAVRILKPGGALVIADFRATHQYAERLRELGMAQVSTRWLTWRFWYGGPWAATKVVSARKPL